VTPGLPLGLQPCNPFALVASLKLGLRQDPKDGVQLLYHQANPLIV